MLQVIGSSKKFLRKTLLISSNRFLQRGLYNLRRGSAVKPDTRSCWGLGKLYNKGGGMVPKVGFNYDQFVKPCSNINEDFEIYADSYLFIREIGKYVDKPKTPPANITTLGPKPVSWIRIIWYIIKESLYHFVNSGFLLQGVRSWSVITGNKVISYLILRY